jgi:hypothetical protein
MPLVWWGEHQIEADPDAAYHLGVAFDLAEWALEQVRRSPSSTAADRVAQVHDERAEVVGEAAGSGGDSAPVEVLDRVKSASINGAAEGEAQTLVEQGVSTSPVRRTSRCIEAAWVWRVFPAGSWVLLPGFRAEWGWIC